MSYENRRAPRSRHDSALEIYDKDGHFITAVGRLVNFSKTGACFAATKVMAKGEQVLVRLRLLKEGALEASAIVVWARKKTNTVLYGIEFKKLKRLKR